MRRPKELSFWVGCTVSLLATWLALRGVPFGRVIAVLRVANYWWLTPSIVMVVTAVWARSERWRALVGSSEVDSMTAFLIMNVGYLVSNILPLRIGDPARAVMLDRRCRVGIARAMSTVLVERVADLLAVTVGLLLLIPCMQVPPEALHWLRVVGVLGCLAIACLGLAVWQRNGMERVFAAIVGRVARLEVERWLIPWRNLMSGLAALSSLRGSLALAGWTLLAWLGSAATFGALLLAFFPGRPFATLAVAAAFLVCAEAFGKTLPATPGNWGVFESIGRVGLVIPFGLPDAESVACVVMIHFTEYLVMTALGLIGMWRFSVSLGTVTQAVQARAEAKRASVPTQSS